ncbi:cupin domain-containing protein [Pseudoruegeria sp. HB172150]|uniref:cupin domain-containing protein n=1 Tax=Pseudoruegeria sp. HB172150 TaxID=2721164 RepID=UPI001C1322C5|nr:cupin domain-containing protein [Pseudoruegeria sp. HB172150]
MRYRQDDPLPGWCELRRFAIHAPGPVTSLPLERQYPRERLLITRGRCQISAGTESMVLRAGQFWDADEGVDDWRVAATTDDAEFLHLSGTWGDEIAGCGIWTLENEPEPSDAGDPVPYAKHTRMDSHYHDYDEYWFILDGAATAVVSGTFAEVAKGDCVTIGTGHHHDMPDVKQKMRGAFFETTLVRRKRLGHLWEHTHGPAEPDPIRSAADMPRDCGNFACLCRC